MIFKSQCIKKVIYVLFVILISINANILADGFGYGTLVWVDNDSQGNKYVPIQNLTIGDQVISFDLARSRLVRDTIVNIESIYPQEELIAIYVDSQDFGGNNFFKADPEQLVFCPEAPGWVKAKHLVKDHILMTCYGKRKIVGICKEKTEGQFRYLYRLTIEKNPHFFVTQRNILVHNFIQFAIALEFGLGHATLATLSTQIVNGLIAAAIGLGIAGVTYAIFQETLPVDFSNVANDMLNHKIFEPRNIGTISCHSTNQTKTKQVLECVINTPTKTRVCKLPNVSIPEKNCGTGNNKNKFPKGNCGLKIPPMKVNECGIKMPTPDLRFCGGGSLPKNKSSSQIGQKPPSDSTTEKIKKILEGSVPGEKTKGKTKQWEKPGGFKEAVEDFGSLNPAEIKKIATGIRGLLSDGRDVNVRFESSDKRPTLEIYDRKTLKRIKIRYGKK